MKIALAAGVIAALGFMVGFGGYAVQQPPTPAAFPTDTDMKRYTNQLIEKHPGASYDAVVDISEPSGSSATNSEFRLFWDVLTPKNADRSYLTAVITPSGIRILAVEAGRLSVLSEYLGDTGSTPGALPKRVILKRRGTQLTLVSDGITRIRAAHPGFAGGSIGVGVPKNQTGLTVELPQVQPITSIVYTDDFMRAADNKGDWMDSPAVHWEVRSLDNPAKSSNAFIYQGWGKGGGMSLVGREYWDNYHLEVSAEGKPAGEIGLVVAAQGQLHTGTNPHRYTVMRWSAASRGDSAHTNKPDQQSVKKKTESQTTTKKKTGDKIKDKNNNTDKGDTVEGASRERVPGRIQLVQVSGATETVLAEKAGGYTPGQWYRLGASLNDGVARFFIDGREVLKAASPQHIGGKAGLYVKGEAPAEFDDFKLVSFDRLERSTAGTKNSAKKSGGWTTIGAIGSATGELSVTGRDRLANVKIQATVTGLNSQWITGLIAGYRGPGDYYAYEIDPQDGKVRLVEVKRGQPKTLAEMSLSTHWDTSKKPASEVIFTIDRGHLKVGSLEAFVPNFRAGRVGVLHRRSPNAPSSQPLAPSAMENFRVTGLATARPVESMNEVFSDEQLMAVWNGAASDWKIPDPRRKPPGYDRVLWHRGFFFGDTEIESALPTTAKKSWKIALSLAKPSRAVRKKVTAAKTPDNPPAKKNKPPKKYTGYVMLLTADIAGGKEKKAEPKEKRYTLKLVRAGKTVAEELLPLPLNDAPRRFRFRRAGAYMVGYIDDQVRLVWHDPEPLTGPRLAIATKGAKFYLAQVRIFNRNLLDYAFNNAPADWRTAGGVWQVTNRWECDPRWSFMAGMPPPLALERANNLKNRLTESAKWKVASLQDQLKLVPDPKSKLAAMWHKGRIRGDFMVESFVGPMMEIARGGSRYQKYIKNFALTIAGDGKNLNSGYSCILGYDNNTRSVILRKGKVVAEVSGARHVIPVTQSFHHKWVRLRVERLGNQITFAAYYQRQKNQPETTIMELSFTDPEPLTGEHMAVWSYGCGMLVSRTRLAAATIDGMENPLAQRPVVAQCVYTKE